MDNKASDTQTEQNMQTAKELGFRPERLCLLDQRLKQWSQAGKTPALVARVLRHGRLAFEAAYGPIAPGAAPNSLQVDSIFPICSMTKPVIATLACIMQEEGLLDLYAPVKEYFPEFTGDGKGMIRLWHFLSHTSGLTGEEFDDYVTNTLGLALPPDDAPDNAWKEFNREAARLMNLSPVDEDHLGRYVYRAVVMAAGGARPPQTAMQYSSFGYDLIKEIIEKISGVSIDEYAREKLFNPLGMHDSHFLFPMEKIDRFVRREEHFTGSRWLNDSVLQSTSGGGGLKSTAVDMAKFGQMYLNGGTFDGRRIISKASVRVLTSNHNLGLPLAFHNGGIFDPAWGLGWNVGSKKDDAGMLRSASSFEHGGFGCVKLLCDPEVDIVAVFFMVSVEDNYPYSAQFNNMVIGALDD